MENIFKVAVDGPAGSGKSSISKMVASKMNIKYIDSGALYRTITYYLLQRDDKILPDIDVSLFERELKIEQHFLQDGKSVTFLNGKDVSLDIRNEVIVKNIGKVSDNVDIRSFVNDMLRKWGKFESVIMDGRDIGTVVFPDAEIKLYIDASPEIRADRRAKEYLEQGKTVDVNDIKKQIIIRDEQDKSRLVGALKRADDAIYLDTSEMTKDEVISKVSEIISEKIHN